MIHTFRADYLASLQPASNNTHDLGADFGVGGGRGRHGGGEENSSEEGCKMHSVVL